MEFLKIFFNKKNLYLHRASCNVCKGNASAAVLHEPRIVHITVLQTKKIANNFYMFLFFCFYIAVLSIMKIMISRISLVVFSKECPGRIIPHLPFCK